MQKTPQLILFSWSMMNLESVGDILREWGYTGRCCYGFYRRLVRAVLPTGPSGSKVMKQQNFRAGNWWRWTSCIYGSLPTTLSSAPTSPINRQNTNSLLKDLWSSRFHIPRFICIYMIYRIYRPWWLWWYKLIININIWLLICNTYYRIRFNTSCFYKSYKCI